MSIGRRSAENVSDRVTHKEGDGPQEHKLEEAHAQRRPQCRPAFFWPTPPDREAEAALWHLWKSKREEVGQNLDDGQQGF